MIKFDIQNFTFKLKTMLDSGSDLNLFQKEVILAQFWRSTNRSIMGLGKQPINMNYEVPKATIFFGSVCLDMKFVLTNIHVACILGTPFLAAIE